uniref:Claudin n=1 Tax=Neogobius melanostomus TaxID=47308 RepID=A0A8C6T414_9GOBI
MASMCRLVTGLVGSCTGWVGLIVATATNDWVHTCDHSMSMCMGMDEVGSRGLWAKCTISPVLSHCTSLSQVLTLPAYILTSRALMISACLLGLPALLLVLMSMPCVRLQNPSITKLNRSRIGGSLYLVMALFGIISTVWFPISAKGLMSFGFSLYAGWVGVALCLLGGIIILWCCGSNPSLSRGDSSFYYSRSRGVAMPRDQPANQPAKSALV